MRHNQWEASVSELAHTIPHLLQGEHSLVRIPHGEFKAAFIWLFADFAGSLQKLPGNNLI